jgi:metal-responsive CopG/Arc/MetJ family transcriptional regulator
MVRVNITFDHETLRLANREARRLRTSRSEFIRAAVRAEAAKNDAAGKELELRQQRREAIEGIRKIAKQAGSWPTTKIVHDFRYRLVKEDH